MENKDLPVLICRGTHYEVGLLVGKRFKSMIQELLESWKYFHEIVKVGSTASGNDIVQNSLSLCKKKFPGYIDEIKGMSDGSGIQFEQLFMLNIDSLLSSAAESESGHNNAELRKSGGTGCTSILCNKDEQILGHTEDAMAEIKNHVYIVSAEIIADDINEEGIVLEKFTTLCYAGTLMGYTMGFNNHGMVYSVNTIFPDVKINGTPRAFVARALLGAKNLDHVLEILKDEGHGVADGFSFNVYFYPNENQKRNVDGRGKKLSFYNIEVAPALPSQNKKPESIIDIHEVQPGNSYCHCNKYLRLRAHECNSIAVKYSDMRDVALCRYCDPSCKKHVKEMLSDESDFDYPIYNNGVGENYEMDFIRTVAVGIFDIEKKTWSVYLGPPASSEPVHVYNIY